MISNGKLNPRVPSPSRQRECSPFHLLSVSSRQEPLRCLGSQTILKSGHLKPGGRTCRSKLTNLRSPLLSCWINSRRQMRTPFPLILSKGLCRPSPLTRLTLQARYGARLRPSRIFFLPWLLGEKDEGFRGSPSAAFHGVRHFFFFAKPLKISMLGG